MLDFFVKSSIFRQISCVNPGDDGIAKQLAAEKKPFRASLGLARTDDIWQSDNRSIVFLILKREIVK